MLTDSHCHLDRLDLQAYQGSIEKLLRACQSGGVSRYLSVATSLDSAQTLHELVGHLPGVYMSVGVHPLQSEPQSLPDVDELLSLASADYVIAIGETGLDKYYSADTLAWQRQSFVRHAEVAQQLGKPLIVHTREAKEETLAILRDHVDPSIGGVLHCFTESWDMAKAALDLNFYISISGIVTFGNAQSLRETVRKIPLDRLLIETDSPWLAPVPYRGKKNEPRYLMAVAESVAELKSVSLEELAQATNENFDKLFKINGGDVRT
ncbi:MAG: hydrolase TatD [Gammaproteobacteria bacterium]|nr:MAG: hydrolase TatD [Gammaproteobacteria bacterium]RLA54952.1 MAG: hydrolase TatD [Gammaproteobacteria bacterium]